MFLFLFVFSFCLTAGSFLLQWVFGLEPCSLCMIDRVLVILLTGVFGLALLHQPKKKGEQIYRLIGGFLATFGILITLRHLWILHLPASEIPDCIPNFDYLLKILPLHEALAMAVKGSHECAKPQSSFLGLSLPTWTLGGFLVIALTSAMPWRLCDKKKVASLPHNIG